MNKSLTLSLIFVMISLIGYAQSAQEIVNDMIEAMGGKDKFYSFGTVTYDYTYLTASGDISIKGKETYVFDKERSHADYSHHAFQSQKTDVVEGFNGTDAWVKYSDVDIEDTNALGTARFMRKTNYYWFAMFFKMNDPGVNLEHKGVKKVEGRMYDLVEVTFDDQVGDAKDIYVLYINQRTKLVDQFLFTVAAFGVTNPYLMRIHYETIQGIQVPADRVYVNSNWEGEILSDDWINVLWENVKFGVPVDLKLFEK